MSGQTIRRQLAPLQRQRIDAAGDAITLHPVSTGNVWVQTASDTRSGRPSLMRPGDWQQVAGGFSWVDLYNPDAVNTITIELIVTAGRYVPAGGGIITMKSVGIAADPLLQAILQGEQFYTTFTESGGGAAGQNAAMVLNNPAGSGVLVLARAPLPDVNNTAPTATLTPYAGAYTGGTAGASAAQLVNAPMTAPPGPAKATAYSDTMDNINAAGTLVPNGFPQTLDLSQYPAPQFELAIAPGYALLYEADTYNDELALGVSWTEIPQ